MPMVMPLWRSAFMVAEAMPEAFARHGGHHGHAGGGQRQPEPTPSSTISAQVSA